MIFDVDLFLIPKNKLSRFLLPFLYFILFSLMF